jgi:hypothetical protein
MTHPLIRRIVSFPVAVLVVAGLAGAAAAQPAGSGAAPPAAADAPPAAAPAAPAAAAPDATGARAQCTAAMNADPAFAKEIVRIADEAAAIKRDADTVNAHADANAHIQKNERHVIYAYAVMWIIAAGFVIYLWRRQQALTAEIAQLHRDLDAASDKPAGGRS